ncbi:MAG TPA: hypothetical protein PKH33_15750 [bacterium]|nr:hypothetical protein [bacterium]
MKKVAGPGWLFTLIVCAAIYCFAHIALLRAGAFPFSNCSGAELELTGERIEEMRDLLRCAVLYAPADARAQQRPLVRVMSLREAFDEAANGASIGYFIDESSKKILLEAGPSSEYHATLLNEKDDIQEWMATYHIKGRGEASFKYIARSEMIAPLSISIMPDNYRALKAFGVVAAALAAFVATLFIRRPVYSGLLAIAGRIKERAGRREKPSCFFILFLFVFIHAALFVIVNRALFSPSHVSLTGGLSERWKMSLYCLIVDSAAEDGDDTELSLRMKSIAEIEREGASGAAVSYFIPERLKDKLEYPWHEIEGAADKMQNIRLIDDRENYQVWEITRQTFNAYRASFRYIALEDALIPVSVEMVPWVLSLMLFVFVAPVSAVIAAATAAPARRALQRAASDPLAR